jgi:2-polyprenyl-3-methyl-5-hydroxy-6-metoxy-1,4-benzoquinol methylase
MKPVTDLAGQSHWDERYARAKPAAADWKPADYDSLALARVLLDTGKRVRPHTILEVGCGDSRWLPYLARELGVESACGIDYSPVGAELARERLAASGVRGEVHCVDMFHAGAEQVGRYDLVYSLGVVEHFEDTAAAIRAILAFVKPGGTLITEVPNMRSFHGLLSWLYQPAVLRKHKPLTLAQLARAHHGLGLEDIRAVRSGLFSLGIPAWGIEPRFPRLERLVHPVINRCARLTDAVLRRVGVYAGMPFFAPFLFVVARKPEGAG